MTDWSAPRTPKGQISRVPHLPGLDGLRAIAVVAVMIYHANRSWLPGGFLGVEVFFVISGYLITLLLIAEHERSGSVDLKQFWLRRFRRLLPALYVMLALLMVYLAVFKPEARGRSRGDILAGIAYISNWFQIWVGAGYTATEDFAPLRHLWSLAVEEQFYLVWPLVMVLILRRGRSRLPRVALWLFGVAVAIALLTAWLYVPGDIDSACTPDAHHGYWIIADRCISINDTLYLSTITRAGGLMLGAAFAMVWRPIAIMRSPMRDRARQLDVLAAIGVLGLAFMVWSIHLAEPALTILTGTRFDPWLFRGGIFLSGILTLFVIAAVTHQRAMTGVLLGNPVLSWVGTRSYGLYLYHWPIYQIIRQEAGKTLTLWQFVLAMLITAALTEASYRFVEMPIRKGAIGEWMRGDRHRPSRSAAARRRQLAALGVVGVMVTGWAGVSIAMAPNQCVGTVECANLAGQQAIDAANPSTTLADAGTTASTDPNATIDPSIATVPGETVPATVPGATLAPETTLPPETTVPVADRPPLAIGESVMLGAAPQMQAGGFVVNADESRQGEITAEIVGQYRASGQIGKIIVIQVGTNGPVSQETYDKIMSFLPPEEVEQVIFLTVAAPRGWIEPNNAIIWSLQGRYPNVKVLDWAGFVVSGQVPGLAGDGIHLGTAAAKQWYANYIFDFMGRRDLVLPLPE
jgi:peptidoglycan/LPS O-acetylase OafA/YrhL